MSDFFVDWFLLLCRKLFGLISFVCFLLFLVFWGAYPKRHYLDWSFKDFAYIFRVLDLKFLSLAHFEVTSTQWGLGINYESSSCGHPIFLVPFMKLSMLSPVHVLGTPEELPLAVSMWICSGLCILLDRPLDHFSASRGLWGSLWLCSVSWNQELCYLPLTPSVKHCSGYSAPFMLSYEF